MYEFIHKIIFIFKKKIIQNLHEKYKNVLIHTYVLRGVLAGYTCTKILNKNTTKI